MSGFARILVTGATGFVGARLCERLALEQGQPVRALIHSWPNAVRVAHLPIEMVRGDLASLPSILEAMKNCDGVVHLATGGRPGIVTGTRHLLAAARQLGVRRLIHMSTTAVHGLQPQGPCREDGDALASVGEPYCDWKIAAERAVWAAIRKGLSAVILRPCIVYGPRSRWNTKTIESLARGRQWLVNGGQGICNLVYVDNLIDAIGAALHREEAAGEAYFITDAEPVSWGAFIDAHSTLLGMESAPPSITLAEVVSHHRSQGGILRRSVRPFLGMLLSPAFRDLLQGVPLFEHALMEVAGRLSPAHKATLRRLQRRPSRAQERERPLPDLVSALVQSCDTRFSSAKAFTRLGYAPRISFPEGMARTGEWLDWAGHLPLHREVQPG